MPRAGNATRLGQNTLGKGCAVVRTLGTNCLNLASSVNQQDLGTFNALDFHFPLLARGQRESCDTLEFVLGHVADLCTEKRLGRDYNITGLCKDFREH